MKRFIGVLALVVLVMALGNAQQIGLKAIGGGIGYASFSYGGFGQSESMGGIAFGAFAHLGEVAPNITLHPSVTYLSASKEPVPDVKIYIHDIAIDANAHYSFPQQGFTPYVGGGLGFNIATVGYESPVVSTPFGSYGGDESESALKIGINLLAGAQVKSGNMTFFAEAGYHIVSDINNFRIMAGLTVPMN